MTDWNKWLKKRELCADNILYVYRRDRKTIIRREDGEEFELFAPVYTLLALFPEDAFLNINKGIAVNKARIVDISSEGVYTMSDGQTLVKASIPCLTDKPFRDANATSAPTASCASKWASMLCRTHSRRQHP